MVGMEGYGEYASSYPDPDVRAEFTEWTERV